MAIYDKEKEDRVMIPKSEYRHLIKLEEQTEHLYRRRKQILAKNEKDKAEGYHFKPEISIDEIDTIFDFHDEPTLLEPVQDDLADALGYTK